MAAFVLPGHDPTISEWRRDVCPPELRRYYCVHGKYVGHRNLFPCPLCDPAERPHVVDVEYSTHDDLQAGRLCIGTKTRRRPGHERRRGDADGLSARRLDT